METKKYLDILNAKNVSFAGNLKLISDINKNDIIDINAEFLSKNRFWIADLQEIHIMKNSMCNYIHIY